MTPLRDIDTLAGCQAVVGVQAAVWGAESEIVPASLLFVSVKRGGILVGAFDGDELVGFVWSMPGWRDGERTHWSHMLAVVPAARGRNLGVRLKLAQRARALAQGAPLIEWTFDPLQAQNAHLNLTRLGAVAGTYLVNAYGEMAGVLHRGTPTDRLIAEWWINRPRVQRRVEQLESAQPAHGADVPAAAPPAIGVRSAGPWVASGPVDTTLEVLHLLVPVPPRFTEMQRDAPAIALAWRLATREAFTAYFARGYRAVDFVPDREGGGGYLVTKLDPGSPLT